MGWSLQFSLDQVWFGLWHAIQWTKGKPVAPLCKHSNSQSAGSSSTKWTRFVQDEFLCCYYFHYCFVYASVSLYLTRSPFRHPHTYTTFDSTVGSGIKGGILSACASIHSFVPWAIKLCKACLYICPIRSIWDGIPLSVWVSVSLPPPHWNNAARLSPAAVTWGYPLISWSNSYC